MDTQMSSSNHNYVKDKQPFTMMKQQLNQNLFVDRQSKSMIRPNQVASVSQEPRKNQVQWKQPSLQLADTT